MKIIGYILAGLGIIISIISKISKASVKLSSLLKFPTDAIGEYGLYLGIILIAAGVVVIMKINGNTSQEKEVPIYQGTKIIGYRRH